MTQPDKDDPLDSAWTAHIRIPRRLLMAESRFVLRSAGDSRQHLAQGAVGQRWRKRTRYGRHLRLFLAAR